MTGKNGSGLSPDGKSLGDKIDKSNVFLQQIAAAKDAISNPGRFIANQVGLQGEFDAGVSWVARQLE